MKDTFLITLLTETHFKFDIIIQNRPKVQKSTYGQFTVTEIQILDN